MKNKSIEIQFNWANVILYTFFLCYGFYGAFTPKYNTEASFFYQFLVQNVMVIAPLIIFSIVAGTRMRKFSDCIVVNKSGIVLYIIALLFFFIILIDKLNFSLYSDEISYAGTAHGQSIHILTILSRYIVLPDINFQYLVQFVSLSLILGLLSFYLIIKNLEWKYKVIVVSFVLIAGRIVFILNGGNGSPHPPIQLFPYFVFSSIFGVHDIVFKFGQLAIYASFIVVLYRMLLRKVSKKVAFTLVLCIGTIPLSLEISTVIEHSIWSYYVFAIVMMELITTSSPNYVRLISLVSIGALMRQPSIIAIAPILIVLIKERFLLSTFFSNTWNSLWLFSPILLFLPFLLRSVLFGTPAVEAPISDTDFLHRIIEAVQSGVIFSSAFNVISIFWLLIIPFSFLIMHGKSKVTSLSFFLFFLILLLVFYSINPGLWGLAKYQVEIVIPFAIIGISGLVFNIFRKSYSEWYLLIFLLSITILNLVNFYKKSNVLESNFDIKSYISLPYNYHDAYDFIQSKDLSSNTYSIGSTYGIMPEIMNGYKTSELFSARNIYIHQNKNFHNTYDYAKSINNNLDIANVLIGLIPNKEALVNNLILFGWTVLRKFDNNEYHTSVIVMQRSTQIKYPLSEVL